VRGWSCFDSVQRSRLSRASERHVINVSVAFLFGSWVRFSNGDALKTASDRTEGLATTSFGTADCDNTLCGQLGDLSVYFTTIENRAISMRRNPPTLNCAVIYTPV